MPGGLLDNTGQWQNVRAVWLLAGSAGATAAVQQFLNAFRTPPPVGFLYAQHYSSAEQGQLAHLSLENTDFSIAVSEDADYLRPAHVVMVPPSSRVSFGQSGEVYNTHVPWGGKHTPNIDEMLASMARAELPMPGVIMFSGMGCDGAASLSCIDAVGGHIWAQSPQTAVCDSMPRAAIADGRVQKVGSPAELAMSLQLLYQI